MTSPDPTPSVHTATEVLFGAAQTGRTIDVLRERHIDAAVGTALHAFPDLHAATALEVAAAAVKLLDLNLLDLLTEGWRRYDQLVDAARRSVADPATTELVALATHHVTCRRRPYVDLVLDSVTLTTVDLDLTVLFDLKMLQAAIKAGKIVALHTGRCDVSATLKVDGIEFPTRSGTVGLDLSITLGDGIRLLPDEDKHQAPVGDQEGGRAR